MRPLALVVDDEPDICNLLSLTLQRMNVDCHTAATLSEAKQALHKHTYSFCLTDLRLPDGDGLQLVEYIQGTPNLELPIAVITAHGNMDTAIKALKLGAFDFVSKPVDLERLRNLAQLALRLDSDQVPQQSDSKKELLLGEAANIRKLRKQISKVARSDAPIYISGESGAGKELAARSIHLQSPRAENPFIAINCGAIPSELMESEFFGHQKGSFTGAHKDHKGLLQSAEGGTLFLDEVADLPLEMQVKLLRAIQEKSIRPIGSNKEISIDTRILSATHKDLSEEVTGGRFRNDLYYRINVIEITVPPLRDRTEDIPLLTDVIMQRIASSAGLTPPALSHEAMIALQNYSFPGNVRQLENILERAFTLSDQNIIREEDLLLECNNSQENSLDKKRSITLPQAEKTTSIENFNANKSDSLDEFLQRIEKEVIEETLVKTRWNRTAAAQKLGISFRSLRYRLKKLGLEN
ncbi:sigma-54-dependent Fis family transcriptional regulator [Microbulbifer sp. A4B17]|uniref:sigma-54-dependent transcriptional regulator n=1 Tax=Microbulbifer sp. A4B17 TaxID=359370 RepID=UPI000D52D8FF|nr:sigma-54 dependent transcriptional regulator [Microbulbifer sp. A4B17]AWF79870.1 sigma-54-dependent Fis family transcriptional regulator [Microbulbifer sp. A4B17]